MRCARVRPRRRGGRTVDRGVRRYRRRTPASQSPQVPERQVLRARTRLKGHNPLMPSRSARVLRSMTAVLATSLAVVGAAIVPLAPAGAAPVCADPLPAGLEGELAARYPGIKVTAAVHETASGCWHHLNEGMQITTASVIKE